MNLRQIRQFVAVAQASSFRKAAEALHMAQPPLTVAIRRLEEELGGVLFVRGSRGVTLTPLGESVLGDATQVLFHADQMRKSAGSLTQGLAGTLRIGFIGSATYTLFPRMLPRFRRRYPQVELELRERTTTQILREVEGGTLDLGLVRYPVVEPTSARIVPVEPDVLVVAMPVDHALAGRKRLALKDLAAQPFIMYSSVAALNLRGQVMLACQAAGFTPRVVQEAVQVQTIVSLVESGLGVALVPSISQVQASERVVFRPLTGDAERFRVAIAVATHPDAEPAAATHFRQMLEAAEAPEKSELKVPLQRASAG